MRHGPIAIASPVAQLHGPPDPAVGRWAGGAESSRLVHQWTASARADLALCDAGDHIWRMRLSGLARKFAHVSGGPSTLALQRNQAQVRRGRGRLSFVRSERKSRVLFRRSLNQISTSAAEWWRVPVGAGERAGARTPSNSPMAGTIAVGGAPGQPVWVTASGTSKMALSRLRAGGRAESAAKR
jgi:hypothetical protein